MSERLPRVVYWNHSPTPYFVDRFNAVTRKEAFSFEAWFNERREQMRSWDVDESTWQFRARYIPRRRLFGQDLNVPVPELVAVAPDLVIQEYDRGHLAVGFFVSKLLARRTAFRVLPNYDAWSDRTWWREVGKHSLFRAVDAAKVPGSDGVALASKYGLPADRIYEVTQSIDVGRWRLGSQLSDAVRAQRRGDLGLSGCVFIFVGRLWSGKGTSELLEAYAALSRDSGDTSLLLVGDGPDEQAIRERAASMPRVRFAGFVQSVDLAELYAISDVMVFPTHGDPHGLVVEEAMACGLPVICSSAAGNIQERLPRTAGRIIPPRDPLRLADAMRELANTPDERRLMGAHARALVERLDSARYADDFERFVKSVLSAPPRRTAAAVLARGTGASLVRNLRDATLAPLIPRHCS